VAVTAVTVGVLILAALHESSADIGSAGAVADSRPLPAGERTFTRAPGGTGKAGGSSDGSTAASRHRWGRPLVADEFDGRLDTKAWEVYDGRGHAGKGWRRRSAVKVRDGVLRITGKPDGTTGGLGWRRGEQKLGRWEARLKLNRSCACYNANLLLWPVNGGGGTAPKGGGGEIDYMETYEDNGLRKGANFFLHYDQREGSEQAGREGNSGRLSDHVKVDLTTWHTFAVEWTEKEINGYVDGRRWFHTARPDVRPPGPMGQAIQLDWMPHLKKNTSPRIDLKKKNRLAVLEVDWIRMYGV
jgi:licheninase